MSFDESQFRPASQILCDMHDLAENHAAIVSIENLGTTAGGIGIDAWRIGAKKNAGAPKALILGGHHGCEWISVEVPFLIGQRLIEDADRPDVRQILDQIEVWVVPVVNPDGNEWSHRPGARLWRKNRRRLPSGNVGVDPNRNYDYRFDSGGASSSDETQPIYKGPFAFSEAESCAVRRAAQAGFECAVSYHSYGQHIRYPVLVQNQTRAADLATLANDMHLAIGAARGSDYPVLPTDGLVNISGECTAWLVQEHGVLAVTVELPPSRYASEYDLFMMDSSEIEPVFEANWLGAIELMQRVAS